MRRTRNLWLSIAFVAALVVASLAAFALGTRPVLGLDLEGGVSVILSAPKGTPHDVMQRALENIRNRVDAFGVGEPLLFLSGNSIEVQLPGLARGTVRTSPKSQYCVVDPAQQAVQCFASQTDAQKALAADVVAPGTQTFCLTGTAVFGKTPQCYTTKDLATQAEKGITVVPEAQASPAPSPTPTPSASPSGSKGSKTTARSCLNGTGLPQAPCFDTKQAAQAALAALSVTTNTAEYCIDDSKGTTLASLGGPACYQTQADAQKALGELRVFHQTQQFCAVSSANVDLGCFLTHDQAAAKLQQTGQERLLQVIGTTARLEQRLETGKLTPASAAYASTPVTCESQTQRTTSACSFQALKDKSVVFWGQGGAKSQTKFELGPVLITGDAIKKATAVYNTGQSGTPGWQIDFTLTSSGSKTFATVTQQNVKKLLAIVVDNQVISDPQIQSAITGGSGVITGSFTKQRAQDLATQLNAGALPVNLKKEQVQTVSPTLGRESLHQGLVAGIVGLVLLVLYLLFYYRLLGIVAWLGMSIWALLAIALVSVAGRAFGYSLTLAGIAGLVISLGVTADSYIVFFERLKDEVRHGKTPRSAVQPAFKRAYRTIVAADTVTGLAAVILYVTAISSVRGFALTLGVATLLDLFVVYFFKRPTVFLIARNERLVNLRGFGLTSGVAADPLAGETAAAIAGGSK